MKGKTMAFKKRILIDLDGVLNNYIGNFDSNFIPPIKNGAEQFVKLLAKDYELKLFTTRSRLLATKWLIKYNLEQYFSEVTNVKEPCLFYIDDRCLQFKGDYNELLNEIKNFSVWWKH